MSEDVVDQPPPPPPSGEDWPARIEQLLGEAESAPSVEERVDRALPGGRDLRAPAERSERRAGDVAGGAGAGSDQRARRAGDGAGGAQQRLLEGADRHHRRGGVRAGRPQAVGGPVGADRVLGRERPGHARRGRQRRARGAEPRAQPRRRAGAAGGPVPAAAQLGQLRRDPDSQTPARDRRSVQAAGVVPRGAPLRAAARWARWRAWRASARRPPTGSRPPMRCAS